VSLPQFSDNDDEVIELLREIRDGVSAIDKEERITLEGSNIDKRVGLIPHNTVQIVETDDLEGVDPGGTITMEPGDTATLAQYRGRPSASYAVGASDVDAVRYTLQVDGNPAVGPTTGPLGTISDPFSFVEAYGGAVPADDRVALKAEYPDSQSGQVELAARLHLEVL